MKTVGEPVMMVAPQPVMSSCRAAGRPPMSTVALPFAIVLGGCGPAERRQHADVLVADARRRQTVDEYRQGTRSRNHPGMIGRVLHTRSGVSHGALRLS